MITHEVGMPKGQSAAIQVGTGISAFSHRFGARFDVRVRGHHKWARGAGAHRRRGMHHPVELPAQPDRRQGRVRTGGGLHRGPQAVRGRASERVHPRRDHRRHRVPAGRVQPRHRASARSWARRWPRTPTSTWCRSPVPHAPDDASPSSAARRSRRSRSSSAASRRTCCSTTPTSRRSVAAGVGAAYANSGQTCSALTRMIVPRSRLAEVEEIAREAAESYTRRRSVRGRHASRPTDLGVQRERVRGYIEKGIDEGADLMTGGADAPDGLDTGLLRASQRSSPTSPAT